MAPTTEYRDDPDAVSLHTTPNDYNYDDAPEIQDLPPSYTDSEGDAPIHASEPDIVLRSIRTDHDGVHLSGDKPQVCETVDVIQARLDTDPMFLERVVRAYAHEPPHPLVYIMGTHKETTKRGDKKETKKVTDFRIVLDLREYFWSSTLPSGGLAHVLTVENVSNGEKTYRGGFMKKRAPGVAQDIEVGGECPSISAWCQEYCASPARLRVFRLSREIVGLDDEFLKNRIEGLIRSTNYRGHLSITFPVEAKNIDMYTSNRINQWRLKKWICWVFYLTFLWIFTWPYLFFATKRWYVVKSKLRFSGLNENGVKKYATISEEEWFNKWHVGIRRLALDKFQGEASYDMLLGVIARPADPPIPGTINTGHAGVDNAVGILHQGFRVASAISRGDNLGRGLQGGWGYDN